MRFEGIRKVVNAVILTVIWAAPAGVTLAQDGPGRDITRADFAAHVPLALIMTGITLAWIVFVIVMARRTIKQEHAEDSQQ